MRVSILVPSYNHARFLPKTIGSVLAQTFQDWELVLVDDLSSDDSVEVASSFRDPRIKIFVNKRNKGTYETQNAALDLAQGEYIAILNSDDYWAPTKLERQLRLLDQHAQGVSFSYTLGTVVDDGGTALDVQDHHGDYPTEDIQDLRLHLVKLNRVLASSVVFRKGAVRFDHSFRYSGDWIAALRLSLQGRAAFVNEPLTFWRHHTSNASRELNYTVPEEIRVRWSILHSLELWGEPSAQQRAALSACSTRLADLFVLLGRMSLARHYYYTANIINSQNLSSLKRMIGAYLPKQISQERIWPGTDAAAFEAMADDYDLSLVTFS